MEGSIADEYNLERLIAQFLERGIATDNFKGWVATELQFWRDLSQERYNFWRMDCGSGTILQTEIDYVVQFLEMRDHTNMIFGWCDISFKQSDGNSRTIFE